LVCTTHTLSHSGTAAPRWSTSFSRSTPLETEGNKHTPELLIEYVIDCKRKQEHRQSLEAAINWFAQHTQSHSGTAAPRWSTSFSRSTPLERASNQHTPELLIEYVIGFKRKQEHRQSLEAAINWFAQHTQSHSGTAAPRWSTGLSRSIPLERAGNQHTPELLIEYVIGGKRKQEHRQSLEAAINWFAQHTLSHTGTAAPRWSTGHGAHSRYV